MKTISPAMAAHLRGETTTLTTCWRITRQDGKVFRYTELDEDVTYQDEVYKSAAGFNKSAMKSSANFAVDEMEVTGFLRDDGISDEEMRNGAFDFALAEVFLINYEDETMGEIKLRYGYFGEVKTTGSGAFLVELRGLVDLLSQKIGDTYLNECRLDLGSKKCGIEIQPPVHRPGSKYKVGDRVLFPLASLIERPRYYPDVVGVYDGSKWYHGDVFGEDINMTPISGGKVLAFTNSNERSISFFPNEIGLTPEQIASGRYKLVFSGQAYGYWADSSGWASVACQYQYFGTNFYFNIAGARRSTEVPSQVPDRRWRPFSVEVDVDPGSKRFSVALGGRPGNDGLTRRIAFDELTIAVMLKDEIEPGYEQYGGIEFIARSAGMTSVDPVELSGVPGAQTVDGTVTWEAVAPRYRFLGEVPELSTRTTQVRSTDLAVADGWLDWGVMTFLTGKNAGRSMEIMGYDRPSGIVSLALPLPYQPQIGDQFTVTAGCNKTASECAAKFKNILNFRGHPRVPGAGQYFKVAGM
ncbi:hypothetical protein HNR26_003878 [Rhizobium rosettiformans]|uniref:DUF2163 domain-containing protein n=2 Tax=Rhizobium rosettiformans TaxID=1368430 RepID=A0A4S8PPK1_9HYPH|nr:DUF2163 domain-containing protein [Rhizobium rosettiformans]MBB5277789.1 hypothetical protein [Rhizobium rosettiformans]THV32950.1 DUF2163 domain-containing protein [Rhizobium rosettiformans W3]